MGRSLNQVKKRMTTVATAQKLTNTMKLVSISKLQRYNKLHHSYASYYEHMAQIDYHPVIEVTKPKLVVCIVPDLGLVSVFTKTLLAQLRHEDMKHLIWIGHQSFDYLNRSYEFVLHNNKTSSEAITLRDMYPLVKPYAQEYDLYVAMAYLKLRTQLEFKFVPLFNALNFDELALYEPNYAAVNKVFAKRMFDALLWESKLQNKIIEHKLRQFAMEQAQDNAKEMMDHLQNQYNQIRQEKITQEISEIISGRES